MMNPADIQPTVTSALTQKGTRRDRIVNLTNSLMPVSGKTKNRAPKDDPVYMAIEKYQQITDLVNYYDALTGALVQSNAVTCVELNGKMESVAYVIYYRTTIVPFLQKVLACAKNHLSISKTAVEAQNIQSEAKLKTMLADSEGADEASIQGTKDLFWLSNRYVLVDPLNAEQLIKELENEIKESGKPLDLKLSASNARTRLHLGAVPAANPYQPTFGDTISVAAAMVEKKDLIQKLPSMLSEIRFVSHGNQNKPSKTDIVLNAVSKYNELKSAITRCNALAVSIIHSNLCTAVRVRDREFTVSHAVEMKDSWISFNRALLNRLKTEKTRVDKEIADSNKECEQRVQTLLEKSSSKDNTKLDADGMGKVEEKFWENNRWELIDPLNIADRIEKLESHITKVESDLNTALSESNALTMITV
jgi:hypothetical protein